MLPVWMRWQGGLVALCHAGLAMVEGSACPLGHGCLAAYSGACWWFWGESGGGGIGCSAPSQSWVPAAWERRRRFV